MQPQKSAVTFAAAMQRWPVFMLLAASACAPAPQAVVASPPPAPADPVLAFVATGAIGQSASVSGGAQGRPVNVTIETQYNSALGEICRTYEIAQPARDMQRLACADGPVWYGVAPLVQADDQAAMP